MQDYERTTLCCERCANGGWCVREDGHLPPHEGLPVREGPERLVQNKALVKEATRTARMAGQELEARKAVAVAVAVAVTEGA